MIKLKNILKEVFFRKDAYSWQKPDGSFLPVSDYSYHGDDAKILVKQLLYPLTNEDSINVLWKHGWQRITHTDNVLYTNNEFSMPNSKQKSMLIYLAKELGFKSIEYDNMKDYKTLWSNEDILQENHPTGDWQSWGDIDEHQKEQFKILLNGYINYISKIYTQGLIVQRIFIIRKTIENLDASDPRLSAKPLAQLDMETRISISDYCYQYGNTGTSKVLELLMELSRQYIEPFKMSTPDIHLKNVTDIVWPDGRSKGDVKIFGLQDLTPTINFGYGPYRLTEDFFKEFSKPHSQLYLDLKQEIKVVNMKEVLEKVKEAIKKFNN